MRIWYQELRETHPPDTPWRLLGTTPARVAQMLRSRGVSAELRTGASRDDVRPGAIVCVDLRVLERRGVPRLHWAVVDEADDRGVRLDGARHAWPAFLRAWRCRASPFPMHRSAIVLPLRSTFAPEGNAFPARALT